MAKENKHWKVHIELIEETDYGKRVVETHDLERYGVSPEQVESRIRHSYKWYDHDDYYGSVSYRYIFTVEEINPKVVQLSIFDLIDDDNNK